MTENEIGKRRLVDAVSHAQQTKIRLQSLNREELSYFVSNLNQSHHQICIRYERDVNIKKNTYNYHNQIY